jgi:hypothetical protein
MPGVAHPTVVLGLDAFGRRVTARLRQATDADDPQLRVVDVDPAGVREALVRVLGELLQAGRVAGELRERRLDLVAFADALDGADDAALARAVAAASEVVGRDFAAIFPRRGPEQRGAGLHLVVRMPPMAPSPEAAKAASRLARVQEAPLAWPLLSRVWLVSEHTTAGTVGADGLVAGCAAFALATLASGLRDRADAVAHRMAHLPEGTAPLAFLSVASLDLPEGRLREYARARAAYDGLRTLVRRVERQSDGSAADSVAMTTLDVDGLLSPFVDGPVAAQVRKSAARLSGGEGDRRTGLAVGAWDGPAVIRARYAWLFGPATVVKEPTRQEREILDDVLRRLDAAEWAAAEEVRGGVQRLFDQTLGQATGLDRLPEVELGLRHVVAALEDQESRDLSAAAAPAAIDPDPLRAELDAAVDALPSSAMLWAAASAMGLAAALVAMGIVAWAVAPSGAAPVAAGAPAAGMVTAAPQAGVNWAAWGPWMALPPVFGLTALAWSWVVGRHTRNAVARALEARRDAVAELQSLGGGGAPGRQAEAQLLLRRRRVRRAARVTLLRAQAQLAAVRRTLWEARDTFRQRLVDLRVDPADDAAADDLRGLLGGGGLLHDHLVPAPVASRWVARCRRLADADVWANRLLDRTWPAVGLKQDVPCGDVDAIDALAEEQIAPLAEQVLFESSDAAAAATATVRAFVARSAAALAPPCEPRDAAGDVPRLLRAGEILCVAPLAARDALSGVLRDAPYPVEALWTELPVARVIFVRTWEGLSLDDLARGAGLSRSQVPT